MNELGQRHGHFAANQPALGAFRIIRFGYIRLLGLFKAKMKGRWLVGWIGRHIAGMSSYSKVASLNIITYNFCVLLLFGYFATT